jgi:hypothetical protein
MLKKSDGFVFVVMDGRFMAIIEHHAKTRLPSNADLGANATRWRFAQKGGRQALWPTAHCCSKSRCAEQNSGRPDRRKPLRHAVQ